MINKCLFAKKVWIFYIFFIVGLAFLYSNPVLSDSPASQKTIILNQFSPYKSKKSQSIEEKIRMKLKRRFNEQGFDVKETSEDVKFLLPQAKKNGAFLVITGFYRFNESAGINIYCQIYNPETGFLIDALNATDEISGIEGVSMDPSESKKSTDETIAEFQKKILLRILSNKKRAERRENIHESITSTYLGSDKELKFPIAEENISTASAEVFKIIEESQTVTVASNVVKEAEKQPASVTVISKDQIQLSGARSVNELLTIFVPGYFTVEDQDDTIAGFRGFASDNNAKVLLLINGHNMNTEYFWGPPDSIINGMNMDFIEKIEIIRGPGSVTLGQGALLGVVNIVTKNGSTVKSGSISAKGGENNFSSFTLQGGSTGKENPDLKTFFQASTIRYNGQELRSEGWAKSQQYAGTEGFYDFKKGITEIITPANSSSYSNGVTLFETPGEPGNPYSVQTFKNVATSKARLKKSDSDSIVGVVNYKNLELNLFYTNQLRDLYNFYRDRNRLQNTIKNIASTYQFDITDKISLKLKNYYTVDDVFLRSQNGLTLGGTREYRYGGSLILSLNEIVKNNRTAIGIEYRKYDMGQANSEGNNFLLNYSKNSNDNKILLDENFQGPNERNRYVYPGSIAVKSFFVEDFFKLSDQVDLFGAFRYDKHPYWGSNFAPRVGSLFGFSKNLRFRLSYQEGFRGVVGLSYTGGFEGDGHLRIQNFPYIQSSNIPSSFDKNGYPSSYYQDVPKTKPEKMRSFEVAANYNFTSNLSMENILFFNKVEKVIDVGVLYCDKPSVGTASIPGPNGCDMPRLGTDIPGNWNGYWFYKNNPGEIRQGGAEISVSYKTRRISSTISHSIVKLITASPGQTDSIYLTSDSNNRQFRGYPANVSRWNSIVHPTDKLSISFTYLYYPYWYSPKNERVEGNHLGNFGLQFKFLENMNAEFVVKNIFASGNLYPMINNAGGPDLSNGTPSVEKRTYWAGLQYTF